MLWIMLENTDACGSGAHYIVAEASFTQATNSEYTSRYLFAQKSDALDSLRFWTRILGENVRAIVRLERGQTPGTAIRNTACMNTESKAAEPQKPQPASKMVEVTIVARFDIPVAAEIADSGSPGFVLNGKTYQFHIVVEEDESLDLDEARLANIGVTYDYVDTQVKPVGANE